MRAKNSVALVALCVAACSSERGVQSVPLDVLVSKVTAAGSGRYIASYVVTNHGTAPICLSTQTVNPKGIAQGEVVKWVLPDGSEKHVRDFPGYPNLEAKPGPPRTYRLPPAGYVSGSAEVTAYSADAASGPTRFAVIIPAMNCLSQSIKYLDWIDVGYGVQSDAPDLKAAKAQAVWAKSDVFQLAQ